MIVRLDPETKAKLTKLARAEGKNNSQIIRELIENYIHDQDLGGYIDDLWKRVETKLRHRGVGKAEIKSSIRQSRDSKK
jgi:predicted DNA-binding protein